MYILSLVANLPSQVPFATSRRSLARHNPRQPEAKGVVKERHSQSKTDGTLFQERHSQSKTDSTLFRERHSQSKTDGTLFRERHAQPKTVGTLYWNSIKKKKKHTRR